MQKRNLLRSGSPRNPAVPWSGRGKKYPSRLHRKFTLAFVDVFVATHNFFVTKAEHRKKPKMGCSLVSYLCHMQLGTFVFIVGIVLCASQGCAPHLRSASQKNVSQKTDHQATRWSHSVYAQLRQHDLNFLTDISSDLPSPNKIIQYKEANVSRQMGIFAGTYVPCTRGTWIAHRHTETAKDQAVRRVLPCVTQHRALVEWIRSQLLSTASTWNTYLRTSLTLVPLQKVDDWKGNTGLSHVFPRDWSAGPSIRENVTVHWTSTQGEQKRNQGARSLLSRIIASKAYQLFCHIKPSHRTRQTRHI